ncbi:permease [Balneola sp. EhC07]|uniref:sulfite exporter TauE/SafE family protein n=1 Tax=Balneola sp. EhC07 TaxID=1849360 RepID=UPI0007F34992|nr:sulfite exporter TauE/SafE family protein [Balneola sp. EhC07]OAN63026.1 permease [Balneola sp. EhC07]
MTLSWIGALLVGLSLGLMGSGGSILTVPILIYISGEPEKAAIAESLGIVGFISLIASIPYALKKQVNWRNVILFGIPGMAGTYGGAYVAGFVSSTFQLMLFSFVMILAAVLMLRNKKITDVDQSLAKQQKWWLIALEGVVVGVLTGLVGVGGGFLIVPALVILGGLPMHVAIGTSLVIIALKSFSGFYKYFEVLESVNQQINWELVLIFSLIGAVGSFVGKIVGSKISGEKLKKGFAIFLLFMGVYIIYMNV